VASSSGFGFISAVASLCPFIAKRRVVRTSELFDVAFWEGLRQDQSVQQIVDSFETTLKSIPTA
jgi:hypothetical protein